MKALLFINGVPPEHLPMADGYDMVACTDGAFHYLKEKKFPLEKLDFISGDFDSLSGMDDQIFSKKFIPTPDQNFTDFEKALQLLHSQEVTSVDIYGGSGGEMDHFLGNLTSAFVFKDVMKIKFFDDFSHYYFLENIELISTAKGQLISLYPFPSAQQITTSGLRWELKEEGLDMTRRIGTRNYALQDEISIRFSSGNLLIFIGKNYM